MGREGAAVKPGGGEIMLGVEERKVRRGLEGMGVPSSSSGVGGGGTVGERSPWGTGGAHGRVV